MNSDIQPATTASTPDVTARATGAMPVQAPPELPISAANQSEPTKPAQKTPKPASDKTGLAIAATVIIVLGLAALATYAYFQTR